MNGLRYSKGATQAADIIAELWNPIAMDALGMEYKVPEGLDNNSAWLLVQKYRNGQRGVNIRLGWQDTFTRFFDRDLIFSNGGQMITYQGLDRIEEARKLMIKYDTIPSVSDVWS
jgi:hypothetical protein